MTLHDLTGEDRNALAKSLPNGALGYLRDGLVVIKEGGLFQPIGENIGEELFFGDLSKAAGQPYRGKGKRIGSPGNYRYIYEDAANAARGVGGAVAGAARTVRDMFSGKRTDPNKHARGARRQREEDAREAEQKRRSEQHAVERDAANKVMRRYGHNTVDPGPEVNTKRKYDAAVAKLKATEITADELKDVLTVYNDRRPEENDRDKLVEMMIRRGSGYNPALAPTEDNTYIAHPSDHDRPSKVRDLARSLRNDHYHEVMDHRGVGAKAVTAIATLGSKGITVNEARAAATAASRWAKDLPDGPLKTKLRQFVHHLRREAKAGYQAAQDEEASRDAGNPSNYKSHHGDPLTLLKSEARPRPHVQMGAVTYAPTPGYTLEDAMEGRSTPTRLRPVEGPEQVQVAPVDPLDFLRAPRLGAEGRLVPPNSGMIGRKPGE